MPRRKLKPDPRQLPLLYDKTPDGVVALRSISWRATGLSRKRWLQVRELAAAVMYCGSTDGCRAHVNSLIRVMNSNRTFPICESRRSFFRIRTAAIACGLLASEVTNTGQGRKGSERAVSLKRIGELQDATRELAREALKARQNLKARKVALGWHLGGTWAPYISNQLNHSNLVDRADEKNAATKDASGKKIPAPGVRRAAGADDPLRVRRAAGQIVEACRGCRSRRDWEFAVKVAILADDFGEHWLRDALGGLATCRPNNGWAYLTTCLGESTAKLGRRLNRELARVDVPASLRYYGQAAREGRLCVSEEL